MRKLFHFDTPPGLYRADACVVSCFDARFEPAIRKFVRRRGLEWTDHVRVAGGARLLASPAAEADRAFAVEQIRLSRNLHQTTRVWLFAHSDCGAYGGLAAFGGDAAREAEHHRAELARAAKVLESEFPGMEMSCFFADFEGVWEAD